MRLARASNPPQKDFGMLAASGWLLKRRGCAHLITGARCLVPGAWWVPGSACSVRRTRARNEEPARHEAPGTRHIEETGAQRPMYCESTKPGMDSALSCPRTVTGRGRAGEREAMTTIVRPETTVNSRSSGT